MKTFTFTYTHQIFGRVTGTAEVTKYIATCDLVKDNITVKALHNNLGDIPLNILNLDEIKRAQFAALDYLTRNPHE